MPHYFSIFIPVVEGGYAIFFPDFPEAISQGDDLPECMEMAADVLAITVEEYAKMRKPMPTPSTHAQAKSFVLNEMKDESGIDATREPLLQLFQAPDIDMTPVRVSISLAKSVLEDIDAKAKQAGLTRSGFLARAANTYRCHEHA